jgi:capsular exopolysaccharide synthesis family protein
MDTSFTLRPIARWWWLIVLSVLLATGASYAAGERQQPIYASRTTLIVGSTFQTPNPTNTDFTLARQLASLYADIAMREPVRNSTMQALGLEGLPNYAVTVPGEGQLIEIVVQDTDPRRAQAVANELAVQLIARVPETTSQVYPEREEFTQEQLSYLEEKIVETQDAIAVAQLDLAEITSAEQIADAQTDLFALQTKLTTLQSTYASLLSATDEEPVNTISVVESADLPTRPVNTENWVYIALAATLGLTLSAAAAYLLEHLDVSLREPEDVMRAADAPVIGRLARASVRSHDGSHRGVLVTDRATPDYEAFRALRINLDSIGAEIPLRSLLVVSPGPRDGKSSVAANLAQAYAHAGRKTLLIDADLRRPSAHKLLGVTNLEGLRHLFAAQRTLKTVAQRSSVSDNLWVIPAGGGGAGPVEILNSPRMKQIIASVNEEYEVTIVDSPPSLLADASVLASSVDGVLVVVRLKHTPESALKHAVEQLRRVNGKIVGLVINDPSRAYSQGYLRYWYGSGRTEPRVRNGRGPIRAFVGRLRGLVRSPRTSALAGEGSDANRGGTAPSREP